jgi:hypothetical protein
MGDSLSIETQLALYADDAKLSRTISSIHDCRTLQTDLDTVQRWSTIWRLNFNTAKCNVLRFTRVLKFDFAYQLNDTVLNSVKFFKDLGLTVTDTLSWKPHIANVVSKANKLLGLVKRTLGFRAPLKSKLLLYKSLVMSTLNYASIIWSPDKGDLILLESVQRRATKYILNDYDSDYKTRLARLDLLPISYIKEFYDLCFFYKCIHRFYDFDISHIIPLPNVRRPGTRLGQDTSRLARQPIRTETAAHFFSHRIVNLWNDLPMSVRSITCTNNFFLPFKSALLIFYKLKLINVFSIEDTCTWISHCRCANCRQI